MDFWFRKTVSIFRRKKLEEIIEEQKAREEIEIKNTYELTIFLFKEVFTEELLEEYIKQTNKLKYPDGSVENYRKIELLNL